MTQLLDRPGVWLQDVYAIRLFLRCPSLMSQALRGPGGTYQFVYAHISVTDLVLSHLCHLPFPLQFSCWQDEVVILSVL